MPHPRCRSAFFSPNLSPFHLTPGDCLQTQHVDAVSTLQLEPTARVGVFLKMPAPVRPASSQMLVLSLNPKFQEPYSVPSVTPLTSAHCLRRDSPGNSSTTTRSRVSKQELHDLIDWSSTRPMEDEDDVADYFDDFRTLADPLVSSCRMSRRECNKLFWQGFHADDRTMLYPRLIGRHPFQKPGADFDYQELFDRVHAILSKWRLKDEAEAEAERQRKLEEDQELKQLILGMWDHSPYDPTYAVLYRQCAQRFPTALGGVPKLKSLPKPTQDAPSQRTLHNRQAPPSSNNHIPQQHGLDLGDDDWSSDEDDDEEEQPLPRTVQPLQPPPRAPPLPAQ